MSDLGVLDQAAYWAIPDNAESPEDALIRVEIASAYKHFLSELMEREREVLLRTLEDGQSSRQIGAALGISHTAVQKIYRRVLPRLQIHMAPYGRPFDLRTGRLWRAVVSQALADALGAQLALPAAMVELAALGLNPDWPATPSDEPEAQHEALAWLSCDDADFVAACRFARVDARRIKDFVIRDLHARVHH